MPASCYNGSMIELGLQRIVAVRTRKGKRLVPVLGADNQPVTKTVNAVVKRITRNELDGSFGRDRGRKLVVTLESIDLLCLKPERTRSGQKLCAPLAEVYRWMVMRRANKAHLEKARERKLSRQRQREQRSIDRAEQRLLRQAREEKYASR